MGLFNKKPTTEEKNQINSTLSKMGTCCKRLESVDSIDKYFTEWDKYLSDYRVIEMYANNGIKFTVPPKKIHAQICQEIPRIEKDVVNRGYDRMMRDAVKLTTDKGKQNKANKFFNELEYYYPRLQVGTVELIKTLKANTPFLKNETVGEAITPITNVARFCGKCGAPLQPDNAFCGKCGAKV